MNKKTLFAILVVPFGVTGTWLAARVWFAIGALYVAIQMVVGKLVLLALAAALGAAFAQAAHAQGNAGFIYARDRGGNEALVYSRMYTDLGRFGSDLITLGHAFDAGVNAVLQSESGQQFIVYTFTANANSSGQDLVRATLDSRSNYQQPTMVEVFVSSFGGSLIGSVSAGLFSGSGNNGGTIYRILQNTPVRILQDGPVTRQAYEAQRLYNTQEASDTNFQYALALAKTARFQH